MISAGFFTLPALNALRAEIKYKVRVDILNKNFSRKEIFIFKKSALNHARWIESDEFILKNDMFDVLKTEAFHGETYIYCLRDAKENNVRKIRDFVANTFNNKPVNAKFHSCRIFTAKSLNSVFINEPELIISLQTFSQKKKETKSNYFSLKNPLAPSDDIPPEFYC